MYTSRRMTARTESLEVRRTLAAQNRLSNHRPGRVARAEKQDVVRRLHDGHYWQQLGPQPQSGLCPRIKALINFPSTCDAIPSTSTPSVLRNARASSML